MARPTPWCELRYPLDPSLETPPRRVVRPIAIIALPIAGGASARAARRLPRCGTARAARRVPGVPLGGSGGPPCPHATDEGLPPVSAAQQVCESLAKPMAVLLVEVDPSEQQ